MIARDTETVSVQDHALLLDRNFVTRTRAGDFPPPRTPLSPEDVDLDRETILRIFDAQMSSRLADLTSRWLRQTGRSYYTIGSSGHENNACFSAALRTDDPAFLHYRSGAFQLDRAYRVPGQSPLFDLMLSFTASSEDPISGGRHKVLGSLALAIPPQTSTIASHLPKAMGAALGVSLAQKIGVKSPYPDDAIIFCNFGDASANHSTATGAINTACWCWHKRTPMPVLFLCEDNGIGISVSTPTHWIRSAYAHRPELHYLSCDGLDLIDTYRCAQQAVKICRDDRRPVFAHMKTVRLLGHAGSDVESVYRNRARIEADLRLDPLLQSARIVVESGYLQQNEIADLYETLRERLRKLADAASLRPKLRTAKEVASSLCPPKRRAIAQSRKTKVSTSYPKEPLGRIINRALVDALEEIPETVVFGEDVARKGGVYGITRGLQAKFGSDRVFDSPLDEQSILGTAIGFSHHNVLPIPEIQFLAYVHNAEDQIRGEAATLSFFSNGQYANPMVIRIAGLGYQKGFGGHFHNDNSFTVFRDIPGIIVACPSQPADGASMLQESLRLAREEGRVVIFLEPIALYPTRDLLVEGDEAWAQSYCPERRIAWGEIGIHGTGEDLALVSYGNGHFLCEQARHILANEHRINCTSLDLRWLVPWPEEALMQALKRFRRVLVVDECRRSGSLSEAILARILETISPLPQVARITGTDAPIPLGDASALMMPSVRDIVAAAQKLCTTESIRGFAHV